MRSNQHCKNTNASYDSPSIIYHDVSNVLYIVLPSVLRTKYYTRRHSSKSEPRRRVAINLHAAPNAASNTSVHDSGGKTRLSGTPSPSPLLLGARRAATNTHGHQSKQSVQAIQVSTMRAGVQGGREARDWWKQHNAPRRHPHPHTHPHHHPHPHPPGQDQYSKNHHSRRSQGAATTGLGGSLGSIFTVVSPAGGGQVFASYSHLQEVLTIFKVNGEKNPSI